MNAKSKIAAAVLTAGVVGLAAGVSSLSAESLWVNPTQPPPGGNVDAPLNVGTKKQIKAGGLSIGSIGGEFVSPGAMLEVLSGFIKATGGLVLETRTSDPAGDGLQAGRIWLRTDVAGAPGGGGGGGGGVAGVSRIIAGSGIAVSPAGGTGEVTVSAAGTPAPASGGFTNFRVFEYTGSQQSWTVPAGATKIMVELWGGGGGGGGGSSCQSAGGAGGYGKSIISLSGATSIPVVVGAGGVGGLSTGDSSGGGSGNDGGTSSFSGIQASGGSGAGVPFGTPALGGTSNAQISIAGEAGEVATQCAGSYGYVSSNGGAAPNGGSGGLGRAGDHSTKNGVIPGGGGGGSVFPGGWSGNSGGNGGNGANGRVIVWW